MDINTKKLKKNAYRITKERYKTALRVRVPGGKLMPNTLKFFKKLQRNTERAICI